MVSSPQLAPTLHIKVLLYFFDLLQNKQCLCRVPPCLCSAGPRVRLFDACIPILRVDIPVSQFLLPYTVHAHLASGPPGAVEGVKAEVPLCPIPIPYPSAALKRHNSSVEASRVWVGALSVHTALRGKRGRVLHVCSI